MSFFRDIYILDTSLRNTTELRGISLYVPFCRSTAWFFVFVLFLFLNFFLLKKKKKEKKKRHKNRHNSNKDNV